VIGPDHGPFGPGFLHRLPPDEFPRGLLSAEFQDFRNNGGGSFEDFSKADLCVDGERLPAETPREPNADHSEFREAVRALWRHEIVAEETAIQVSLLEQATWLEFAGGGTVKVNANWSAFAQAGYQFAVAPGNVHRNGFTGDFGLRYTW
jgi:hypothetical protein